MNSNTGKGELPFPRICHLANTNAKWCELSEIQEAAPESKTPVIEGETVLPPSAVSASVEETGGGGGTGLPPSAVSVSVEETGGGGGTGLPPSTHCVFAGVFVKP
jgi:hypothetical protein